MNSILQTEKECYYTGSTVNLHQHHIFPGALRKASEEWGCWVWLRADYHNASPRGVHFNRTLDLALKRDAQERFEQLHGHDKFMEVFGKSYL